MVLVYLTQLKSRRVLFCNSLFSILSFINKKLENEYCYKFNRKINFIKSNQSNKVETNECWN